MPLDERSVTLPVSKVVAVIREADGYSDRVLLKKNSRVSDNIPDYLASLTKSLDGKGNVTKNDILALLAPDYKALHIESYRVSYGDEFTFQNQCMACGSVSRHMIDLSQLVIDPLPEGSDGGTDPLFDLKLPRSKRKCKLGFLNGHKEKLISDAIASSGSFDRNQSDFLSIRQLEGCDPVTYEDIIKLAALDHKAIRDKQREITCGYDTNVVVVCEACGNRDVIDITMSRDFLFPGG